MTFTPTDEQAACVDLFGQGQTMAIEAGAGTGKTATLLLLAESTQARGQYVAFNRAIVNEASAKFPDNVGARTMHSVAMGQTGQRFRHRLNSGRMSGQQIARHLGIEDLTVRVDDGNNKRLSGGFLAGLVMRAITSFCNSDADMPTKSFVRYIDGIDMPISEGVKGTANNNLVKDHLEPYLAKAWLDLIQPNGVLRYQHDHYLKLWEREGPIIPGDFILVDEAQDISPVMASAIAQQDGAQIVYVGDSQQSIYGWRGAVNALANVAADERRFLTRSFRFGPEVAAVANGLLARLGAELRVEGAGPAGRIGLVDEPDCYLYRTNAGAVSRVLRLQQQGRKPALLGGADFVVRFAKAAADLMVGKRTYHPELACFDDWAEVQRYVAEDPMGGELALMVRIIEEFGVETIIEALSRTPNEEQADCLVSTAHKAKGREWASVKLGDDFPELDNPEQDVSDEEMRLLYVAVTRAERELDLSLTCLAD